VETGELVGYIVWQPAVIEEIGAEFLLMHVRNPLSALLFVARRFNAIDVQYQDLHAILYSAAKSAGVQISCNTVTTVSANPPRVELASGDTLYADLIIGADGSHSIVHEAVEWEENVGQSDKDSFSAYVWVFWSLHSLFL
jgi:salicylate hydroxylase